MNPVNELKSLLSAAQAPTQGIVVQKDGTGIYCATQNGVQGPFLSTQPVNVNDVVSISNGSVSPAPSTAAVTLPNTYLL